MRINEQTIIRLNRTTGQIFQSILRDKYGIQSDVRIGDEGLSFRVMNKWHDLKFFLREGSQVWVLFDTEANGDETLKELVERRLKERASENEVEKSKYLDRRRVILNGDYVKVEARLKKVPCAGEEGVLEEEVRTYITKPTLSAVIEYNHK